MVHYSALLTSYLSEPETNKWYSSQSSNLNVKKTVTNLEIGIVQTI